MADLSNLTPKSPGSVPWRQFYVLSRNDLTRALPPYFDLIAVAGNCPRCGGKGWFTDYGPSHGCDYNCGRCGCGDEIKQQGIGPGTGKIVDTVRSGDLVWRNGWVAAADAEIGQQVSLFDGVARRENRS